MRFFCTTMIYKHYRIVGAIDIGIETKAGGIIYVTECIRAEETTPFGIVVPGLQIVIPGFRVVVIAAVTQGIDLRDLVLLGSVVSRYGLNRVAPFIITVHYKSIAGCIRDPYDIAKLVGDVEILHAVQDEPQRYAARAVLEEEHVLAGLLCHKSAPR